MNWNHSEGSSPHWVDMQLSAPKSNDEPVSDLSTPHTLHSTDRLVPSPVGQRAPNISAGGDILSGQSSQFCKVCQVSLSGVEPARQHYAGKSHKKATNKAAMLSTGSAFPLRCDACQVDFTGEICAKQHYDSQRHLKVVNAAKRLASLGHGQGYEGFGIPRNIAMNFPSSGSSGTPPSSRDKSSQFGRESEDCCGSNPMEVESSNEYNGSPEHIETVKTMPADSSGTSSKCVDPMGNPQAPQDLTGSTAHEISTSAVKENKSRSLHTECPEKTKGAHPTSGQTRTEPSSSSDIRRPTEIIAGSTSGNGQNLKQKLVQFFSASFEDYLKQIIPVMADNFASFVIDTMSRDPTLGGTINSNSISSPASAGDLKAPSRDEQIFSRNVPTSKAEPLSLSDDEYEDASGPDEQHLRVKNTASIAESNLDQSGRSDAFNPVDGINQTSPAKREESKVDRKHSEQNDLSGTPMQLRSSSVRDAELPEGLERKKLNGLGVIHESAATLGVNGGGTGYPSASPPPGLPQPPPGLLPPHPAHLFPAVNRAQTAQSLSVKGSGPGDTSDAKYAKHWASLTEQRR